MKATAKKIYEWFVVVEGRRTFPVDMLRYDSCFPYREEDSALIAQQGGIDSDRRMRVVLCRRGVNQHSGSLARWESFGWVVVLATDDANEAISFARGGVMAPRSEKA